MASGCCKWRDSMAVKAAAAIVSAVVMSSQSARSSASLIASLKSTWVAKPASALKWRQREQLVEVRLEASPAFKVHGAQA